jgi:transposase InsO family protein
MRKKKAPAELSALDIPEPPPALDPKEHLRIVQTILQGAEPASATKRGQQRQRQVEQKIRQETVALFRWTQTMQVTQLELAAKLDLLPGTLRCWLHSEQPPSCSLVLRGRPAVQAEPEQCRQMRALLQLWGPGLGVPTLRTWFPDLPRAEIHSLVQDYRQEWIQQHLRWVQVLHWQKPGTVWTMDFARPPRPVDGLYRYMLAVRDLGSGRQLAWLPLDPATAAKTIAALTMLFTIYGPPLVLKNDNGSPFIHEDMNRFLKGWGVTQLFSPPACPGYNGACEASIRWLKVWTEAQAAARGHPGFWTTPDTEAALGYANEHVRAWRGHGPTREEVWSKREAISGTTRDKFCADVAAALQQTIPEGEEEAGLSVADRRAYERKAIEHVLVAHDLLQFSRRRISPRIFRKKMVSNG